jgi:flagellar biosynthesis protein FlhG
MAKSSKQQAARRIVAVGGGKGGVGKSVVSANLGIGLAQAGQRVVLIDGDLGAANLHTMFGIIRPEQTLMNFINKETESLADVLIETAVPRLGLIAGAGAVPGVANINHGQKQRLLRSIQRVDADVVIVDVGAGSSFNVVDLFDVADIRLVVVTPQVPSLVNAYAFLKASVYRVLGKLVAANKKESLLSSQLNSAETERVSDWLAAIERQETGLAGQIRSALDNFGVRIVGNQLYVDKDLRQIHAISRMARDFLSLTAPVVTALWRSQAVDNSVMRRSPFLLGGSTDGNVPALRRLAEAVLEEDIESLREGRRLSQEALGEPNQPEAQKGKVGEDEQTDRPEVENYVERTDRREVDWMATLRWPAGVAQVRVCDVSRDGALVEGSCALNVGARATLIFDHLERQPKVTVEVRNVPDQNRFGLLFVGGGDTPTIVFDAACASSG